MHCTDLFHPRRQTNAEQSTKRIEVMQAPTYQLLEIANGKPIKLWTEGVPVENEARQQLMNTARMPFIFKHLA